MPRTKKTKLESLNTIDGIDRTAPQLATASIAAPPVSKLDNLKVSHSSQAPQPKRIGSIDELFNFHGAKYPTYNTDEYRVVIGNMNTIDLQTECYRVGLLPNENKNVMIERLMKEFGRVTASINSKKPDRIILKIDKHAENILSEGANKNYAGR